MGKLVDIRLTFEYNVVKNKFKAVMLVEFRGI